MVDFAAEAVIRMFDEDPYSRDWIGSKMVEGPYL